MGIITAKGQEAKESAQQGGSSSVDLKKVFVKLKDGDSLKVRLLTAEDYVEYKGHGSYSKGIWTQPCIKPAGKECALCEASNHDTGVKDNNGYNEWNHIYAKKRYLFVFGDLKSGKLRAFDATQKQGKAIMSSIAEYAESVGDVAFTFKRVGEGTDTTYTLSPILKMKEEEQEAFDGFDDVEVELDFYETCLQERTRKQQIADLKKAGFPVDEVFGDEAKDLEDENQEGEAESQEGEDVNPEDAF